VRLDPSILGDDSRPGFGPLKPGCDINDWCMTRDDELFPFHRFVPLFLFHFDRYRVSDGIL
jgi:hypothetical protein